MNSVIAILAGTILTPRQRIENGVIVVEGCRIAGVGHKEQVRIPPQARVIDHRDGVVVPGFIDIHIHGGGGRDLMEASPEAVNAVAMHLATHGTTSFLATTVTAGLEQTIKSVQGLSKVIHAWGDAVPVGGAEPLGIHFEGPFLSVEKRGVHPAAHLLKPEIKTLARLIEAADGTARALTLAPELEGALAALDYARSRGVRVGLGHSNATYEVAERAIAFGASHAVHIFNAMRAFSHRDPGILGATLTDDRVSAELIADGVHVDAVAMRLLVRSKGLERIILITDGLSCAGMPDGSYPLGEFTVQVAGGTCRAADGTLAGSTLTLDTALKNFARSAGLSFEQCLPCATLNPARLLGLEKQKGVIAPGADADLSVFDRKLDLTDTFVGGVSAWRDIEAPIH